MMFREVKRRVCVSSCVRTCCYRILSLQQLSVLPLSAHEKLRSVDMICDENNVSFNFVTAEAVSHTLASPKENECHKHPSANQ